MDAEKVVLDWVQGRPEDVAAAILDLQDSVSRQVLWDEAVAFASSRVARVEQRATEKRTLVDALPSLPARQPRVIE